MPNPAGETLSYDLSPYESLPFFYTKPEHLSAIGMIFGMTPPALPTARVLELGSAAGGSLLTFASRYPQSRTLGIDLSKAQIEHGQAQVQALGLKNIELKAMSLLEVDESFGLFDYIICHGVYSWVPDLVRAKILEIASKNLSPNGIVFISYNTLPGWNQMATLRDMLRFHTGQFEDLQEKAQQAKLFLGFLSSAMEGKEDSHSRFLKREADHLEDKPESYLLHEYLVVDNQPYYFLDFMRDASAWGLVYVGDTYLSTMSAGDLPEAVSASLMQVGDIVKREQYLDFIQNRRFRGSLLCHEQVPLNRNPSPGVMAKLFFSMNASSERELTGIDCRDDTEAVDFYASGGKESVITADTRVMKAVMLSFVQSNGKEVTVEDILSSVLSMLPELEAAPLREELNEVFLTMVLKEVLRAVAAPSLAIHTLSERPKVSELARFQAQNPVAVWVANQANESIAISDFERLALRYLTGEHTREEIVALLLREQVATGELSVDFEGEPEADEALVTQALRVLLDTMLEKIRWQFLLIA